MTCVAAEPIDPSLSPDDIESRALTWRMGGFLAKGVVTGLVGLPGAGKSTFARRVVAALMRGLALPSLLPEGLQPPRVPGPTGVLWRGGEKAADSMIKRGLEAVQAYPRCWRFLPGAATTTRLDEAGIERVFRVCTHCDLGLSVRQPVPRHDRGEIEASEPQAELAMAMIFSRSKIEHRRQVTYDVRFPAG